MNSRSLRSLLGNRSVAVKQDSKCLHAQKALSTAPTAPKEHLCGAGYTALSIELFNEVSGYAETCPVRLPYRRSLCLLP